jgi:chemotaxis regulatin CheY-phosphate phosphatase CheZ
MELMTACSFQDLTGQRINKVVNSLNISRRSNRCLDD